MEQALEEMLTLLYPKPASDELLALYSQSALKEICFDIPEKHA
jgi:hypothetical protein